MSTEDEILDIIRHEWLYGLEIIRRSEARKGKVRRGGLYVILGKMEEEGRVESRPGDISFGIQRYQYRATKSGLRDLDLDPNLIPQPT